MPAPSRRNEKKRCGSQQVQGGASAIPLAQSSSAWSATVTLPAGTAFQYKYIAKDANGNVTWELDPNHGALPTLLHAVNPGAVHLAVVVVMLYAALRIAEAWGLWRAKAWASWLGCIGTAAYLPLDGFALYHHRGWHTWAVVIVNVLVVAILARDLFRRRNG